MGFQWLESTFSFKKDINIEDLIKTSRPVLIEFSAACDFSQNKKELKNIYWELSLVSGKKSQKFFENIEV